MSLLRVGPVADGELLRLLPDRAVRLLVERRAAGRELAQVVVLRPHQRRAVAERPADPLAVELAVVEQLLDEVRLRERRPTDSGKRAPAVPEVGRRRLRQELLQITVAAADDRQV